MDVAGGVDFEASAGVDFFSEVSGDDGFLGAAVAGYVDDAVFAAVAVGVCVEDESSDADAFFDFCGAFVSGDEAGVGFPGEAVSLPASA